MVDACLSPRSGSVRRGIIHAIAILRSFAGHRKFAAKDLRRAERKKHNQVIRTLGRHLCRVIFKILIQERPYWIDP